MTPRSYTPTKADAERAKVEADRRAAAQAAKEERQSREAFLEQRQQDRCKSVHHSASTLRANTTAAVMAQMAGAAARRRGATEEVKQLEDSLRRQRDDFRTKWQAHGRELNGTAAESRNAANRARNRVREANLMEAHRSTAERLNLFRQSAEAQSALNDAKRMMAEQVRREAGLTVVRESLTRASAERAAEATRLRQKKDKEAQRADSGRQRHLEAHKASASRVELEASPERVRELKSIEAQRKAGLTGGLRRQNRAFEALALERREEEAANRQRMHDAVICARYGVPAGVPLHEIKLGSGS
jgi:colicin import membrane protein